MGRQRLDQLERDRRRFVGAMRLVIIIGLLIGALLLFQNKPRTVERPLQGSYWSIPHMPFGTDTSDKRQAGNQVMTYLIGVS